MFDKYSFNKFVGINLDGVKKIGLKECISKNVIIPHYIRYANKNVYSKTFEYKCI